MTLDDFMKTYSDQVLHEIVADCECRNVLNQFYKERLQAARKEIQRRGLKRRNPLNK